MILKIYDYFVNKLKIFYKINVCIKSFVLRIQQQ